MSQAARHDMHVVFDTLLCIRGRRDDVVILGINGRGDHFQSSNAVEVYYKRV